GRVAAGACLPKRSWAVPSVSKRDRLRRGSGGVARSDRRATRDALDQGEGVLDMRLLNMACDEDETRTAIVGRPARQPVEGVDDLLGALDDGGPVWLLRDIHQSLHAKQVRACIAGDCIQEELQRAQGDRPVAHQAEAADVVAMAVSGPVARRLTPMLL